MPTLATKEYCTGCTACVSACAGDCISMVPDENGFLYPDVDNAKCVQCGLCEKSCPVLNPLTVSEYGLKAYAAYAKDEEMRLQSSSGGVFTEIAKSILQRGGSVFGAAYDAQFDVVHICAENEEDLAKLRGAKYAQSDLRGVFAQIKQKLDAGQPVLFSGTPCQVGGLKAFLRREYENLVMVDFVCHSVPAPVAWRAYVRHRANLDNQGKLPGGINLRSKKTGWTNYQYSNEFTYADGHAHSVKSGDSLYMKLFVGGYINRESCANCQFKGFHRVSDLTIGDFWGVWDICPEMDDNKGTSAVLVQSRRGAELLQNIADRLVLKPVTPEAISSQNGAILRSSPPHTKRREALALICGGEIQKCESWFAPVKPSVLQRIRRFAGRIAHKLGKNK